MGASTKSPAPSDWVLSHGDGFAGGHTRITGPGMPDPGRALDFYAEVRADARDRMTIRPYAEYRQNDPKSMEFLKAAFPEEAGFRVQVHQGKAREGGNGEYIRIAFPQIPTRILATGEGRGPDGTGLTQEEKVGKAAVRDQFVEEFLLGSFRRAENELAFRHLSKSIPSQTAEAVRACLPDKASALVEYERFEVQVKRQANVYAEINSPETGLSKRLSSTLSAPSPRSRRSRAAVA